MNIHCLFNHKASAQFRVEDTGHSKQAEFASFSVGHFDRPSLHCYLVWAAAGEPSVDQMDLILFKKLK
jgi:hypothetical protein